MLSQTGTLAVGPGHPIRLTQDELALVLNADPELSDPNDAAERAVHELVGAGLIYRDGRFLAPTRAALYFERPSGE